MKKYISILAALIIAVAAFAQNQNSANNGHKNYRANELKYIQGLNILNESDFAEFTIIFNSYKDARRNIRQKTKMIKAADGEELTNDEAAANISNKVIRQTLYAEIYVDYVKDLQAKFTNQQVLSILKAQDKYKKVMFKELRDDSVKAVEEAKEAKAGN